MSTNMNASIIFCHSAP